MPTPLPGNEQPTQSGLIPPTLNLLTSSPSDFSLVDPTEQISYTPLSTSKPTPTLVQSGSLPTISLTPTKSIAPANSPIKSLEEEEDGLPSDVTLSNRKLFTLRLHNEDSCANNEDELTSSSLRIASKTRKAD